MKISFYIYFYICSQILYLNASCTFAQKYNYKFQFILYIYIFNYDSIDTPITRLEL